MDEEAYRPGTRVNVWTKDSRRYVGNGLILDTRGLGTVSKRRVLIEGGMQAFDSTCHYETDFGIHSLKPFAHQLLQRIRVFKKEGDAAVYTRTFKEKGDRGSIEAFEILSGDQGKQLFALAIFRKGTPMYLPVSELVFPAYAEN